MGMGGMGGGGMGGGLQVQIGDSQFANLSMMAGESAQQAAMRFTSENGLKSCIVGGLAAKLGQASGGGMMTVDVADLI
jgi:hypothetical protein